jgi:hypothetical protein
MKNRKLLVLSAMIVALGLLALVTACGPTLQNKMSYQGRLTDSGGNPVNGTRNLTFRLFTALTGGTAIWQETQNGVDVNNGLFNVVLGANNALDEANFHQPLYLEVVVAGYTLSPRQQLLGAPYAFSLVPGAVVRGSITASETYSSTLSTMNLSSGQGLAVYSASGVGAAIQGGGSARWGSALRVYNGNTSHGMATYMVNRSDYATAHFDNTGTGQVLWLTNGGTNASGANGGDFINARGQPGSDVQFRVLTNGQARSDVGFVTPASDMAEMLPAVKGLEPGDTLVIGPQGKLARSTERYQPTVVGVYSTQPGFVGGHPVEDKLEAHVPLAIAGIVPVKASTENGPIAPGDLLATSSTPGYAMKAAEAKPGTILGKALGELASGTGTVDVLIMLR